MALITETNPGIATDPDVSNAFKGINEFFAEQNRRREERRYGKRSKSPPKLRVKHSKSAKVIRQHQKRIRDKREKLRLEIRPIEISIGIELWGLRDDLSDAAFGSILKLLNVTREAARDMIHRAYVKYSLPDRRRELIEHFKERVRNKNKSKVAREIGISRQMIYSILKGSHTPTKLAPIRKWLNSRAR